MKALVVDDSRAMRALLRKMVSELGFEVLEAEHGQAALECLDDSAEVAFALVDWNMPVMDGLQFVQSVREDRRWDRLPLVMVTSETNPRHVYEALKAGADEYAMKPVTRDVIREKLCMLGVPGVAG
jgi:two-component system, chemotaxis family, chemotaxis protein CheY